MRAKCLALVLGGLVTASSASAAVVYSDFAAGQSYVSGQGWTVQQSQYIAGDFTPIADYTLTSITLAFGYFSNSTDTFNFALTSNASGSPGTVIESWTTQAATIFGQPDLMTLNSVGSVPLVAGQTYWITAESATASANGAWNLNDHNPGILGIDGSRDQGASWQADNSDLSPAFEVDGITPEPTCVAFLCALPLFLSRRRSRC